jgi:hypothetical protein
MHLIGEMLDDGRGGPRDPALWGSTGVAHSVAVHEFVAGVLTRVTGRRPG